LHPARQVPIVLADDLIRFQGGGLHGPPFLFLPTERPQHEGLEARIADAVAPTIEHMGYELVRVQVSGKERPVVQIMADRADGTAFRVEDCEAISHAVGAVLDVEDPIKGEWSLEVSSAGIDRPLTRTKDWTNYAGHLATMELMVPKDGRRRFRGTILGADAETVRMRLDEGADIVVPRADIRRAKLVLTDALIEATAAAAGLPDQDIPDPQDDTDAGEPAAEAPQSARRN
jgi:ribosome maturation factor RimP